MMAKPTTSPSVMNVDDESYGGDQGENDGYGSEANLSSHRLGKKKDSVASNARQSMKGK